MISSEMLQSAISNFSVWRQDDVCAPHKPQLLFYVLSHYKAGHPQLFNYSEEINKLLTHLLKEFGQKRRTDYPNMPFWRLRTDGFWEITDAEGCKPRKDSTRFLYSTDQFTLRDNSLIIIDEPELFLHSTLEIDFVGFLKKNI